MSAAAMPPIIQGGMGIGVSDWRLARAVAATGQLGVVSGTAVDTLLVRRLQDGDVGGHIRRAMARFPISDVSAAVLRRYFLPYGRPEGEPYAPVPLYRTSVSLARERLTILANFVEVFLAREGHDGRVGINLLTKVQLPNLASLYGAMLAGVVEPPLLTSGDELRALGSFLGSRTAYAARDVVEFLLGERAVDSDAAVSS